MTTSKPEILIVASDTHCGSHQGLAAPQNQLSSGNTVSFGKNIHQAWLWKNWMEAKKQVKKILGKDSAIFLINGDATEGCHHGNAEVIASTIDEHTNIAVGCFSKFFEGLNLSATLVVKGTECHTQNMEHVLAEKLKAVTSKAKAKWLFEVKGCLVDATHHIGTTSRAYLEASMFSINLGNARLNAIRAGHRPASVFLRAHRHVGGYFCDGTGLMGVTGAWQFLTRYGHKVVPDSIPSPTILVLDWRRKKQGELPEVHEIKFQPPQDEIFTF